MQLKSLALALPVAVLLSSAATAQEYTLDLANEYSGATPPGLADIHFAELVKEKTGGRVEVVNQLGGSAGFKSADMIDAIGAGALPMGNFPLEVGAGRNPMYLVTNLPLIGQTLAEAETMQEIARPYVEAAMEEDNLALLYMVIWPAVGVWSAEAIEAPEDFDGLKIRVNHPIAMELFRAAGASPVQISWSDVVPQLQVGAIEAVHASISGISLGLPTNIVPYYNDIGTHVGQAAAAINLDTLNELPEDLRAAVMEAAAETEAWNRAQIADLVASEEQHVADEGGTVVSEFSPELIGFLREKAQPIVDEWLAKSGESGTEFLDAYRSATQ
ncbi:TRAP transporter substrate-binding protein [Acuticoccus sp. M5D2P5]|uniref:TRAP transporter substrate-binding protein n=1 Tax=Acuticoccus kalidii TaxID=2910977 RepID=UPI001F451740|nr:TRAP transporter substrate-binding protein [Acuticoccus kalidii]MCF3934807.1 TRAP transporter substrate-binding protein [Acuticoccus kalidii]